MANCFALQDISITDIAPPNGDIGIVETHRDERGFVVLLRTRGAPCTATLRVEGLFPRRHYRVVGGRYAFCRADDRGIARIGIDVRELVMLFARPVA